MKRALTFLLAACMLLALAGCTAQWVDRPSLIISGNCYIDPYMPVKELPEGYALAGELTAREANDTGLKGCEYYTSDSDSSIYVYQECGTPISADTVDNTRRQWAYKQWICEGAADR